MGKVEIMYENRYGFGVLERKHIVPGDVAAFDAVEKRIVEVIEEHKNVWVYVLGFGGNDTRVFFSGNSARVVNSEDDLVIDDEKAKKVLVEALRDAKESCRLKR